MIKAIMSRIFAAVVGNSSEKITAFGFSPSTKGWWVWGWSSPWIRLFGSGQAAPVSFMAWRSWYLFSNEKWD